MNEVFLIGKIVTKIEYKFIINSKNTAITQFKIEIIKGQQIDIVAYNYVADYIYRSMDIYNIVFISGRLENNRVCAFEIKKLWEN